MVVDNVVFVSTLDNIENTEFRQLMAKIMNNPYEPPSTDLSTESSFLGIYKTCLVISGVFYVIVWFSPWIQSYIFPEEVMQVLAYNGYGSVISLPMWFWWSYLLATIIIYVGMFLMKRAFRLPFILIIALALLIQPFSGIVMTPGIFLMLVDSSTLLQGFIIGLAYFSSVSEKFQ